MVAHIFSPKTQQAALCELEASLVYIVNLGPASVTWWDLVKKNMYLETEYQQKQMNLTTFKYVIQWLWREERPIHNFFFMQYFQYIHTYTLKTKQNCKKILNPI